MSGPDATSGEWLAEFVDERGQPCAETVRAVDRAAALATLPGPARLALRRLAPAPDAEAARAARELAELLAAGSPLQASLEAVAADAHGALQADLQRAARAAAEGASVEQALRGGASPLADDALLLALASAGAARGGAASGLRLVSALLAWRHEVLARVRAALLYPALVAALLPLLGALMFTALGAREAQLAATGEYRVAPGSAQETFLSGARVAAARSGLVWSLAVGAALLAGSSPWWLAGVALRAPAQARAQRLLALAELVRAGSPPAVAWALAGGAGAGPRAPSEGIAWSSSLQAEGVISDAERAALAALETAPPAVQADELAALARARLVVLERRARGVAALVHVVVLALSGTAVAWMAARLLGGEAPA